jgi:environmental stress-induced protein Ves
MHRVLTPAEYRQTAWKNGGGRTTELAAHPPGVDFARFAWRASVADVARDGPFSEFAGVDRTLVLLRGAGMSLTGGAATLDVRVPFEPVTFAGDIACTCVLHDGPVQDFNLMLRRGQARGGVDVVRDRGVAVRPARFRLCYAASGACECLLPGLAPMRLAERDTLFIDAGDEPPAALHVNPSSSDAVALVAAIDLIGDAA